MSFNGEYVFKTREFTYFLNIFFFDRRPVPFGGSRCIETYSSTTSRSRPRTRGESIRG